jgi:hypothetical protein
MLGLRLPRLVTTLISVAFLMIAVALGALYLWSPRATLRITTGPAGGNAQRFISRAKSKLMAATLLANQIDAPDTDNENPLLPVHPGVAAYLTNGDQSFFDEFQQYFYYIGIPVSLLACSAALVTGFLCSW